MQIYMIFNETKCWFLHLIIENAQGLWRHLVKEGSFLHVVSSYMKGVDKWRHENCKLISFWLLVDNESLYIVVSLLSLNKFYHYFVMAIRGLQQLYWHKQKKLSNFPNEKSIKNCAFNFIFVLHIHSITKTNIISENAKIAQFILFFVMTS